MDCFASLAMTESAEMLTKTPHLFDEATAITAGDSRWQGRTSRIIGPLSARSAAPRRRRFCGR